MAHHTQYVILHNDGHTQSYVGNPQPTYAKAQTEMMRLSIDDGYELTQLHITEVPA